MPIMKKSLFILLALALLGFGGTMYGYYSHDDSVRLDTAVPPPGREQPTIAVYVTGAVNSPGMVSLSAEKRVADAVNACGGVLPTADAEAINMAQPLKDGMQIRVPEKASSALSPRSLPAATGQKAGEALVNINTADEAALATLPGIGPAMAKRIIEYRLESGQFQTPEDIKKVRGIGPAKYEKLKDKITV